MKKGFTLIEILLVIGIASIIFAFSAPFALDFYRKQLVEEARSNIIEAFQKARNNAMLQKSDNSSGVSFNLVDNSIVIFEGSSTSTRNQDQDQAFPISGDISISGLTDVIFSKLTGLPSATGTITLIFGSISKGILVDNNGIIYKKD